LNCIRPSFVGHIIEIIEDCYSTNFSYITPREISQVLLTLFTNALEAIKETKPVSPKVAIRSQNTEEGIIITVCNNGGNIEENTIQKIFDPYFSTKKEKNGTGMSLYITKLIIEKQHAGRISAENKDDELCVRIELKGKPHGTK